MVGRLGGEFLVSSKSLAFGIKNGLLKMQMFIVGTFASLILGLEKIESESGRQLSAART